MCKRTEIPTCLASHEYAHILNDIQHITASNDFHSWMHTFREVNQVVDAFAKHGLGVSSNVIFYLVPPFPSLVVHADVHCICFHQGF